MLDGLSAAAEIVYVNDSSHDGSMVLLTTLHESDPRVAVVDLSRNFGKEIALTAGSITRTATPSSSSMPTCRIRRSSSPTWFARGGTGTTSC